MVGSPELHWVWPGSGGGRKKKKPRSDQCALESCLIPYAHRVPPPSGRTEPWLVLGSVRAVQCCTCCPCKLSLPWLPQHLLISRHSTACSSHAHLGGSSLFAPWKGREGSVAASWPSPRLSPGQTLELPHTGPATFILSVFIPSLLPQVLTGGLKDTVEPVTT